MHGHILKYYKDFKMIISCDERSEAGGVNDNERHLCHSPVSSPTEELRKDKRRRSSVGLENR